MDYTFMRELSILMDPVNFLGNDWRMLAHLMGFSYPEIRKLEREQEPTKALVTAYTGRTGKTEIEVLRDLGEFAGSLERADVGVLVENVIGHLGGSSQSEDDQDAEGMVLQEIDKMKTKELCQRAVYESCECLRLYIKEKIVDPDKLSLRELLLKREYRAKFATLMENDMLSSAEFSLLYPDNKTDFDVDLLGFDLLFLLIRNISPPTGVIWSTLPGQDETDPHHDVIRLRDFYRKITGESQNAQRVTNLVKETEMPVKRLGGDPLYILSGKRKFDPEASRKDEFMEKSRKAKMKRLGCIIVPVVTMLISATIVIVTWYVYNCCRDSADIPAFNPCDDPHVEMKVFNVSDGGIVGQVHFKYVSRKNWGAMPGRDGPDGHLPETISDVIIIRHNTMRHYNDTTESCNYVQALQKEYMSIKFNWNDIAYNFLVGFDGVIYEGTGWGIEGAHTNSWNRRSIGVAFLGMEGLNTSQLALQAIQTFLKYGVHIGKLSENYTLHAHCQLTSAFESPGHNVMQEMKHWDPPIKKRIIAANDHHLRERILGKAGWWCCLDFEAVSGNFTTPDLDDAYLRLPC